MKQNAQADKPFSLNQHVVKWLMQWDQLIDQHGSMVDGME
jgi:hypothetical protein